MFLCSAGLSTLVATGRNPNTEGLGLELTGVELTDRGYIKVNERLQTTAPGVWAIGEVAGSSQFTHITIDDFRLNPPAMRSYLPLTIKKTELVLAGQSKTQMFDSIKAAFDKKELPMPEAGAMCYMMSKQQYLGDRNGHWHPHLMFFVQQTDAATWGADLRGAPILTLDNAPDPLTIFLIPVRQWLDGTPDLPAEH